MRRALAAAVAALALPASASAAEFEVRAEPSATFNPSELTVAVGDTVNFSNAGGNHNVHFEDGQFIQPAMPSTDSWRVSRTFQAAGHFKYVCDQHASFGMTGVIHVGSAGGGGGGGGGTQGGGPSITPPPTVKALRLAKAKGRRIRVRLRAGAASTARVTLARLKRGRYRKVKAVKRKLGTTTRTLTFRAKRPGRYRVTVQLTDAAGNKGPAKTKKIRLS